MISIVIPAYNEELFLPRLLESIRKQAFKDYEIIVADNDSTDGTVRAAINAGARVVRGGLPAAARNRGAEAAGGEYLLFLDADTVLPDGFLDKLFKKFEDDYLDICTLMYKPIDSRKMIYKTLFEFANTYFKMMEYIKPQGGGACIFITKRLHRRIGGFDESRRTSEDNDYINRASETGRFKVYSDLFIYVSVRRMEKEGLNIYIQKIIRSTFVYFFTGRSDEKVKYEFGNFAEVLIKNRVKTRTIDKIIMYKLLSRFNRIRHRLIAQLNKMGIDDSVLRVKKRKKKD
ncbi:MAG: glycosyltransferase [Spirochaetes bacterium]|nr:glycosyltransferase [Spirochaetota bacterium]